MTAPYQQDFSLIDLVLAQQRDMTAVERFSSLHEVSRFSQPNYRSLIPLTRPQPGEQYAFVVDLDRCSGCKACVSACHSLNGLDEAEMWRSAGTILGDDSPYLQTITASCHHCVDPACAAGCPVLAYEKDPATGIVRHLDDQCIGCQYCVLKCPYDVPKYSRAKGIVRKCDMCHSRLSVGEAPACAQACPHEAIRIDIVCQDTVRVAARGPGVQMLPGAFPSSYTLPTTRYTSERPIPGLARPAAAPVPREHAHWPLIVMLLLTQAAVGLHSVAFALESTQRAAATKPLWLLATAVLILGLAASALHLGRPLKAWRAFLGWRRSWMSREIIAFGGYALASIALLAIPSHFPFSALVAALGIASVGCSAMIYVDTQRPGWTGGRVFPRFFSASLILGGHFAALGLAGSAGRIEAGLLLAALTAKIGMLFLERRKLQTQLVLFVLTFAFSLLAVADHRPVLWNLLASLSAVAGLVVERWLFFAATPAPRMPGAQLA